MHPFLKEMVLHNTYHFIPLSFFMKQYIQELSPQVYEEILWPPFYSSQSSIVWMSQSLFNPFSIDKQLASFQLSEDNLLNHRKNKIK